MAVQSQGVESGTLSLRWMSFGIRLLLTLFGIGVSYVYAQPSSSLYYLKYSRENGLPGSSVYGIAQDKEGYLWVGTDRGLAKFDGTSFHTDALEQHLPSTLIERVFNWGEDSLLVCALRPTAKYVLHNGNWRKMLFSNKKTPGARYWQCQKGKSLSFRTTRSVFHFDSEGLKRMHHWEREENQLYYGHYHFNKDSFFVSMERESFFLGKDTTYLEGYKKISAMLDLKDSILFFTPNEMLVYKEGQVRQQMSLLPNGSDILYVLMDRFQRLWFSGVTGGLYILENGEIKEISKSIGIDGDYVTYMFKDRNQNIWISTESSGLFCFPEGLFTNYGVSDGLKSGNITSMAEFRGNIYVGTNQGVYQLSDEGILGGQELAKKLGVCPENYSSFDEYIYGICTSDTFMTVGATNLRGIQHYCNSFPIFTYKHSSNLWLGDTLVSVNGSVLVSTLAPDHGKTLNYYQRIDWEERSNINFLLRLDNGRILFGPSVGLYTTTSRIERNLRVDIDIFEKDPTFYDYVKDKEGNLWFATSKGLLKRDTDKKWHQWTDKDGLTSNTLSAVEIDADGTIWVGTDFGLNAFYNNQFANFTGGSGLISNNITKLLFQESENVLWVGTDKGISKLNLNLGVNANNQSFPLYVTKVEVVGDTTYNADELPELSLSQNNLRIHFSALNYTNPSEVLYQYRLLPGDSTWRSSSKNHAEYPALGANNYQFEVRSKVPGKTWSESAIAGFSLRPPFWKTALFTWTMVLLLFASSSMVFVYRLRVVKEREKNKSLMLDQINHLEQQALSLSMNPHFIFNSLNSIQFYLSEIKNREATKYISNFAKLIRMNMDSSKQRVISLMDEVERLNLYLSLEKARFGKEFNFQINVSQELELDNPEIPSMVIQPLIENGIWHGVLPSPKAGNIEVAIKLSGDDAIDIAITDNGIGLTAAKKNARKNHKSKGLGLTRKRLAYLSEKNYLRVEEMMDDAGNVLGTRSTAHIQLED